MSIQSRSSDHVMEEVERHLFNDVELEYVDCDLCGSNRTTPFLESLDRNMPIHLGTPNSTMSAKPWFLVRCQNCDLVFLNPRPVRLNLKSYYPETYYAYNSHKPNVAKGWKSSIKRFVRRHDHLYYLVGRLRGGFEDPIVKEVGWVPPGTILEVGCGSGTLLDLLSTFGWRTLGIDISEKAVSVANKKGHKVWLGDITETKITDNCVDVVYMSHVLEHTLSPLQTLQAVKKILRSKGILIIEVPNVGSMLLDVFKDCSASLDLPRHLYQFTSTTLSRLVTNIGFKIVNIRTKAVPIYILQSIVLRLLDQYDRSEHPEKVDIELLLKNENFHRVLLPFCSELEKIEQGNNLRLIAECVK